MEDPVPQFQEQLTIVDVEPVRDLHLMHQI